LDPCQISRKYHIVTKIINKKEGKTFVYQDGCTEFFPAKKYQCSKCRFLSKVGAVWVDDEFGGHWDRSHERLVCEKGVDDLLYLGKGCGLYEGWSPYTKDDE